MKLNPLNSSTQTKPHDAAGRAQLPVGQAIQPVSASAGPEDDRQRSVQQDLNEFEQNAIATFGGGERILADTRELAAELTALGTHADTLMKPLALLSQLHAIDDKA